MCIYICIHICSGENIMYINQFKRYLPIFYIYIYIILYPMVFYPYQETLDTFAQLKQLYGFDHQTPVNTNATMIYV